MIGLIVAPEARPRAKAATHDIHGGRTQVWRRGARGKAERRAPLPSCASYCFMTAIMEAAATTMDQAPGEAIAPALQSVVILVEMPPAAMHFPTSPAATMAEMSTAGVVVAVPEQSADMYVLEVDAAQVPPYFMESPPRSGAQVPEVALAVGMAAVAVPEQSAVLNVCCQYV